MNSTIITTPAELKSLWRVLTLIYVDPYSPVWYDFQSLKPFKSLPEGKLQFVDVQVRGDDSLSYTLLVGLTNSDDMLILSMDLHSFAALTLVEPLCFLPDNFLDVYLVLHHEFLELGNGTCIWFRVQCGKAILNAPLSSLAGWRSICFRRVRQVQAKLHNYTPLEFEFQLDE